jgi:hypothetical protein
MRIELRENDSEGDNIAIKAHRVDKIRKVYTHLANYRKDASSQLECCIGRLWGVSREREKGRGGGRERG